MSELPILYTIEHSGNTFGDFLNRTALNARQQFRFSDYGTLDTVPKHTQVIAGELSRGLIDLNRPPDHPNLYPTYDFAKPVPNLIWKPGQEPTAEERSFLYEDIYQKYQNEILQHVQGFKKPGIVVAWHNTAHYEIGKDEKGVTQIMKPFVLSNLGDENSSNGISTSCSPDFLESLAAKFRYNLNLYGLPSEVYFNFVMKGGNTAEHYNTRRHPELNLDYPLQSLQMEYDTLITHDQKTLDPKKDNIQKFKKAFEDAITLTYIEQLT